MVAVPHIRPEPAFPRRPLQVAIQHFHRRIIGAHHYGGDRPGANLFGNSLVAVDAMTGKLKWYFQTVHHDLWDYDLPPQPTLVDVVHDGKKIPALIQSTKTGLIFILDRRDGKPIYGVEERPVPRGDVAGEWYSPTQPFPLKPPPLTRM